MIRRGDDLLLAKSICNHHEAYSYPGLRTHGEIPWFISQHDLVGGLNPPEKY